MRPAVNVPVNVDPKPQSEWAQTTKTPCSEPKTRFGEYRGLKVTKTTVYHLASGKNPKASPKGSARGSRCDETAEVLIHTSLQRTWPSVYLIP